MPTDPRSTDVIFTTLKWLFGIAIFGVVAWWFLPDDWRIKYAAEYWLDINKVTIEHKPHNCDWNSAPLGSKNCHYEPIEGVGVDRNNLPSDQNVDKVYVGWGKVED
jgi:hypothetical protein